MFLKPIYRLLQDIDKELNKLMWTKVLPAHLLEGL